MVIVAFHFGYIYLKLSLAELLVGDESRLTVPAPANDSTLSSVLMVCNNSRLFSSASCTSELIFNSFHVIQPSPISILVSSAPKFDNSLLTFDCTI